MQGTSQLPEWPAGAFQHRTTPLPAVHSSSGWWDLRPISVITSSWVKRHFNLQSWSRVRGCRGMPTTSWCTEATLLAHDALRVPAEDMRTVLGRALCRLLSYSSNHSLINSSPWKPSLSTLLKQELWTQNLRHIFYLPGAKHWVIKTQT